jgi:hypothetical protein
MSRIQSEFDKENQAQLAAYERSQRYRFQEQCFLNFYKAEIFKQLDNYSDAHGKGRRWRILEGGQGDDLWDHARVDDPDISGKPVGSSIYTYDHINVIDAVDPAKIVSLFNQQDGADLFFRLDSSILTQLKPVVEIYKIYPQTGRGGTTGNNPEGPNVNIPVIHRVPMPLGENIKPDEEGMPSSRRDLSSLEDLFYDQNVLGNAMLTDLNFKFAGQNIALLNTVEDISFTISFSSFNLFKHKFKTTVPDEPTNSPPTKELVWSYQDLISYSTRNLPEQAATSPIESEEIRDSLSCYTPATFTAQTTIADYTAQVNPDYFEIQMAVRYEPDDIDWSLVEGAAAGGSAFTFTSDEIRALKSFLRNSAIVLRLQFVAHTIRYNSKSSGADPELVIDFEYKAFIESTLNSQDLDIFKLSSEPNRQIANMEAFLGEARRLLYQVQREKLTLGAVFGEQGGLATDGTPGGKYFELRDLIDKDTRNPLSWLIWHHSDVGRHSKGIIPTEGDVDMAEAHVKPGTRSTPVPEKYRTIHRGLQSARQGYDESSLETTLGSSGAAVSVFQELVNKLTAQVKVLQRAKIQDKYKNLFEALYAQERIYSAVVTLEQVGGPDDINEQEMATTRKSWSPTLAANSVKIVRGPNVGGNPPTSAPAANSLFGANTGVIDQFNKLNQQAVNTGMSNQVQSQAQQLAAGLGAEAFNGPSADGRDKVIYFTNLGDIIDTVVAIASYPDRGLFKRRLGLLLGPLIERSNPGSSASNYIFNLAWVPVSLKSLMGFFATKVIASGRERYLLNDFIKELIENLILPSLGSRCIEGAQEGNQQVGTITFTCEMRERIVGGKQDPVKIPPFWPNNGVPSPAPPLEDHYPPDGDGYYLLYNNNVVRGGGQGEIAGFTPLTWSNTATPPGSIKNLTKVSPNTPVEDLFHYMFIYVNNYSPIGLDPREETKNINNGIYYLHLGQIPSIVKQSNFRKENIPYVREARAMGQLTRTGGVALRDVYHFQCTMYGNNVFKPGMLFFVDPTKDGSLNYDDWKELGLVGFYRIIEVDHQVFTGMTPIHETSVAAKWETFGSCKDVSGLIDTELRSVNILGAGALQSDVTQGGLRGAV